MLLDAHLVAGIISGALTSLVLHPLDVLKVRFQVQDGVVNTIRYRTLVGAIKDVWVSEGMAGFYRGVVPALWGSSASWGLYFYFYESCKRRMGGGGGDGGVRLSSTQHAYAAWEAGTITSLFTNPIWLVKTRMQLQTGATVAPYASMTHALTSILREDGIPGLYRGIIPALFLTLHGVVQFVVYEHLKAGPLGTSDGGVFSAGLVSKVAAATITYPYQVAKSRLQQRFSQGEAQYKGLWDCIQKTWAKEGAGGFYKGFTANILRVAPSSALTLLAYERIKQRVDVLNESLLK